MTNETIVQPARQSINPSNWGDAFQMDQAQVVTGTTRSLRCSGQISCVPDADGPMGIRIVSPNEMRGQLACALDNLDKILGQAGMDRNNILQLRFFTTDMDAFLEHYEVYANWIEPAGIQPPQSVIGVARLVMPELLVEIEMEAAT